MVTIQKQLVPLLLTIAGVGSCRFPSNSSAVRASKGSANDGPPPAMICDRGEYLPFSFDPVGNVPPDSVTFAGITPAQLSLRPLASKLIRLDLCFIADTGEANLKRVVVLTPDRLPRFHVYTPAPTEVSGVAAAIMGDYSELSISLRDGAAVNTGTQLRGWTPPSGVGFVSVVSGSFAATGLFTPASTNGRIAVETATISQHDAIAEADTSCPAGTVLQSGMFHVGSFSIASRSCVTNNIAGDSYRFLSLTVVDGDPRLDGDARREIVLANPTDAVFHYEKTHHNAADGWRLVLPKAVYTFVTSDQVGTVGGTPVAVKFFKSSYNGASAPDRKILSPACLPLNCNLD